MSALPINNYTFNLTESECYEILEFNWKKGRLQQETNYFFKNLEELQKVGNLGILLKDKSPKSKESKIYKLVVNNWNFFESIGTEFKELTYFLSYRAIVYILNLYQFPLKVDYSKQPKVTIKKTTTNFKYTEEESLAILKFNQEKLEESSGCSIYELKNTTNLTKAVKTNQTYFYRTLRENLSELELLGCSKTKIWNLTYRGVVFLLQHYKYPLNLNVQTVKEPVIQKVVQLRPKQEPVVEVIKDNKPNTELIKAFLKKAVEEKKARALADMEKAEDSKLELQIVNDALWHIEQAEELLQEVNV